MAIEQSVKKIDLQNRRVMTVTYPLAWGPKKLSYQILLDFFWAQGTFLLSCAQRYSQRSIVGDLAHWLNIFVTSHARLTEYEVLHYVARFVVSCGNKIETENSQNRQGRATKIANLKIQKVL